MFVACFLNKYVLAYLAPTKYGSGILGDTMEIKTGKIYEGVDIYLYLA